MNHPGGHSITVGPVAISEALGCEGEYLGSY
jgi:hypothetical protein